MMDCIKIMSALHYSRPISSPRLLAAHKSDIKELDTPGSLDELHTVLSRITDEQPFSETLYKGKYQFFIWEHLLPYWKPLADTFQNSIAVCVAKPKNLSGLDTNINELSSQRFGGMPLTLEFESFMDDETQAFRHNLTALEKVSRKYDLYPLQKGVGKKIMSMCSSVDGNWKFPVIVVCHNANPKGEIYFGIFRFNNKETRLFIDEQGSVSTQEDLPVISDLICTHVGYQSPYTPVQLSAVARYDFLEYECKSEHELRPILETSLVIECEWSHPSTILQSLPPECRALVKITSKNGDANSGAYLTTREILQAEAFVFNKGIDYTLVEALVPVKDIEGGVEVLVEESRNTGLINVEQSQDPTTSQSSFDEVLMNQRKDLDFTDKLWLLLKGTKELNTVINALKYIYNNLATEVTFEPYVADSNQSRLACDIRTIKQRNVHCPDFTFALVAEYMAEIGIDKLRKDYSNIFLRLELAPFSSFRKYLEPALVYNADDPFNYPVLLCQACKNLRKLQSVLELTIVCVKRLSLSKENLSVVVRDVLRHYEEKDFNPFHTFNFAISPTKARNLLNPMRPTLWELSILSSSNDEMKQSIHHFKTSPTHEHIYAPKDYPLKLMLPNASYSYYKGILLQSKKTGSNQWYKL